MILSKFPVKSLCRLNSLRNYSCRKTKRDMVVTITGGNSKVAHIVALLLKQCSLIDELRIFDFKEGTCGIAMDVDLIDTNCVAKSYTGFETLTDAITGADVVVICGGDAIKQDQNELELFENSAAYVRTIALYAAEFNPHTMLCIGTPPITAMVPLASEEYKKAKCYDARKIFGITTLGVMRASSIIASYTKEDPSKISCPIVGAIGSKTMVPVVSQTKMGRTLTTAIQDAIRNKAAAAEREALIFKRDENAGACSVSCGFAITRFVTSVVRGLLDVFKGYECAFVRQTGNVSSFLPYMSSVIKLGKYGVESIHMPHTTSFEGIHLQRASATIRQQIEWGECYITGANPRTERRCSDKSLTPCELVNIRLAGRVPYRLDAPDVKKYGRLVPDN